MKLVHVFSVIDSATADGQRRWLEPLARTYGAELVLLEASTVAGALRELLVDDPDAIVCMSVDATGGRLDGLLGSVSEDVLRSGHHRCVLVGPAVRSIGSLSDGPVVVCLDGSHTSESIVPLGAEWARATSGGAWAVTVVEDLHFPSDVSESAYVRAMAGRLGVPDAGWETLHGSDVAGAITEFAAGVDAGSIVMSTHGRSGLARIAMGSVAIRVVHRARCPVIVRRPQAPMLTAVADLSGQGASDVG